MNTSDDTFVGLDLGTTNIKAVVTDATGHVLVERALPVPLVYVDAGGVEQDLEGIWSTTLSVLGEAAGAVDSSRIRAIGVSSQGGAMQVLGARGEPLGRVIS